MAGATEQVCSPWVAMETLMQFSIGDLTCHVIYWHDRARLMLFQRKFSFGIRNSNLLHMSTIETVKDLVERFEQHRDAYVSGKYNETQLRREFLDPFFESLGWDVFNKRGDSEVYKQVIHEDSLEIEGSNKAPDYAFRIGGARKFFVEAKRPAIKIESDIHPAFQLRRYTWSAKLPLSILTDFEEFAVYDCRIKPDKVHSI